MPQAIDRKDVERLIGEGAQVVEVLPKEEFEEDHLRGPSVSRSEASKRRPRTGSTRRSRSSSTAGIPPET